MAATAVAAFAAGMVAAFGAVDMPSHPPATTAHDARKDEAAEKAASAIECSSERECYDRIAACIARGGDWRGNEKAGSCHGRDD